MIIQENVHLAEKTTMKIGGYCDLFYIPESEDELIKIAQEIYDNKKRVLILSGGSNLLINDNKHFEEIVYMGKSNTELTDLGEGRFYIGASNRIQKVISYVNSLGWGGFEKLIGLPAMFGGVIYMNAGIGGEKNSLFTISDFLITVRAYDLEQKKIVNLPVDSCLFSHRSSIFHRNKHIVLGAEIQCRKIINEEAQKIKKDRLQFCKENFEYAKGCFGTCFSKANYKILKAVSYYEKIIKLGKGRVTFGRKNKNWLVNNGGGRYKDAVRIINACKLFHFLCLRKATCEVVIWE